jgi:gamma-glutamylcyclotransferase (GGCT)/AIG2-like uncharacterized protein YtfP
MRKIKIIRSKDALAQARKYYLAYGMNTNLSSMQSRCPEARNLGTVSVIGHKLCFKNHCDLVVDKNSSVTCVLWSITQECEQNLDMLEGYPDYYSKKNVTVEFQGKNIQAMVYFMRDREQESLPSQSYLDLVVQGYMENNLDTEQLRQAILSAHRKEKTQFRNLLYK